MDKTIRQIRRTLKKLGFEPDVSRRGGDFTINLRYCPFWGQPVEQHGDVICPFHLGLIRGIAGATNSGSLRVSLMPLVRPNLCVAEIARAG